MSKTLVIVSGKARTLLCAGGIFFINLYICRELFRTQYLNQMGSIEAAFIGLVRYITRNFSDLTWFPLWYDGIPYQDSYPPLLHWMAAILAAAFRWSPALSYHFVTASFYCLGPVSLFFLCLEFSRSRAYSFFAGLAFSILSPSAFVIPQIRHEIGVLRIRRLQALLSWGEGPHVAALAMLPLAVVWLHRAVTRRRPIDFAICAVLFAATVSLNWLGAVALFAAVIAYVCSTSLRRGLPVIPIALLAYGMIAPWIPPSTIRTIRINAPYLGPFGRVYAEMTVHLALLALAAAAAG